MERWMQQLKETYINMINTRLAEGTYEGRMIPDPSADWGQTEVYTDRQQQRIANLLNTLTTVDNAPDQVQRTLDPRIKQLGLDPNDPKFKSDMETYRTRLANMLGAKGVEVPDKITPDTQITGASIFPSDRRAFDRDQQYLSKQKRDAITQAAKEKAFRVQSIGAQQTAKAANTFTPRIKGQHLPGLLGAGLAALGLASGAKAEDIASGLMDPISTPFDRSAGLGSDKLDTDTDKYYDKQGRPKRSAWPADATDVQGKPITNWSPEK